MLVSPWAKPCTGDDERRRAGAICSHRCAAVGIAVVDGGVELDLVLLPVFAEGDARLAHRSAGGGTDCAAVPLPATARCCRPPAKRPTVISASASFIRQAQHAFTRQQNMEIALAVGPGIGCTVPPWPSSRIALRQSRQFALLAGDRPFLQRLQRAQQLRARGGFHRALFVLTVQRAIQRRPGGWPTGGTGTAGRRLSGRCPTDLRRRTAAPRPPRQPSLRLTLQVMTTLTFGRGRWFHRYG